MKKSTVLTRTAILLGIVVLANLIASRAFFRLDFTADKRYTLSKATKDILGSLDGVVNVTAYFSKEIPPALMATKQDLQDLLVEYETRAKGNLVFEFVNPNENEEEEQKAQQAGIMPIMVNVQERDQVQQLRAYMGARIEIDGRQETIPVFQPGAAMENALTTAIKKLSVEDKPRVAFLQGHGEPGDRALAQVGKQLSVLYDVEPLFLDDTTEISPSYRALAIVNPSDTIPPEHLAKIDRYLENGGNLFVAVDVLESNFEYMSLKNNELPGLATWLRAKGIELGKDCMTDAQCGMVSVRQQQGGFMLTSQIQFPYFVQADNFGQHPVTAGLESVLLPFSATVRYVGDSAAGVVAVPLVLTSDKTGAVSPPAMLEVEKRWQESDFNLGSQPLAIALEGPLAGTAVSRMVVVGNGSFALSGDGREQQPVRPDNLNLMVNAIDWLADDTGLIQLRTKAVTSRPLTRLDDTARNLVKYGNVLAPVFLVLAYAFIRRQAYLRRRQKWLEGRYD